MNNASRKTSLDDKLNVLLAAVFLAFIPLMCIDAASTDDAAVAQAPAAAHAVTVVATR